MSIRKLQPRRANVRATCTNAGDAGAAGIEFLGLLPLAILGIGIALQTMASVSVAQTTHQAAREGARAYSTSGSWSHAERVVRETLPRGAVVRSVKPVGHHHGVRVEVQAPLMHRTLVSEVIAQEVEMP